MIRLRTVFATFVLLLAVFSITHLVSFPGTVAHFRDATGGQKILDMQASTSAAETSARLAALGEEGRALYLRLIVTIDIVFPMAVLLFLVTLARFAAQRARLQPWAHHLLVALPIVYVGFDMLENLSALTLLLHYPTPVDWLAASIGTLTRGKRLFMASALVVPHLVLVVFVDRWRKAHQALTS